MELVSSFCSFLWAEVSGQRVIRGEDNISLSNLVPHGVAFDTMIYYEVDRTIKMTMIC